MPSRHWNAAASRERINNILRQADSRLLVIAGPCSIHDVEGALEYGQKLNALRQALICSPFQSSCHSFPCLPLNGGADCDCSHEPSRYDQRN